jgi:hypothetical protein
MAEIAANVGYRRLMKRTRRVAVMLALAAALTAATATAVSPATLVRDGISYGAAENLSGVYFTNFENSTFVLCNRKEGECHNWSGSPKSYGLNCQPIACAELDARIKALNGSHDKWGLFAIDFVGRRSTGPDQSRWLGDPAKKVLVERVRGLTLLEFQ